MTDAGENPKLNQAVELFSIGEVTSAVRLLLEALISKPGDPAVLSHLRYLEKLSPDSLAQVESELGMSVEHVMSRARDPIEVSVGERDYVYYGLPPHLREDAETEEEPQDIASLCGANDTETVDVPVRELWSQNDDGR